MRKLATILIMFAALSLAAQEALPTRPGNLAQRIRSAQSLMRTRPDLALDLFKQLSEEYPGQDHLLFELSRAHIRMEQFEEAELILRDLLERSPNSLGMGAELARLLLRTNREEEGRRLAESIYLSGAMRAESFMALADLYRNADRYDLAESAYKLGLERLSKRDERGRARLMEGLVEEYSISGRLDAILLAFADWQKDYATHAPTRSLVRATERLLRDHEDLGDQQALADSLSNSPDSSRLAPLLREVYFAAADWPSYLRETSKVYAGDGIARRAWLKNEARRCKDHPLVARELWEALLAEHADSAEARQARLALLELDLKDDARSRLIGGSGDAGLANDLKELSRVDWGYRENLQIFLLRQDFLRARLGDAKAAEEASREALLKPFNWFPREEIWRVEVELGLNLLAQAHDDEARGLFEALNEGSRTREGETLQGPADFDRRLLRLEAYLSTSFHLARMDILAGELSAAQDSLASMAKEYPSSRQANDALEDALLLAESGAWPESLAKLLRGSLELEIRQQPGAAADRLALFTEEFPEDESLPTLLYRMGILYERAYRSSDAMDAWLRLEVNFPEHHRAALALERAARLALRMGDVSRSRKLVNDLLDRHPESTQIPGLRELREQVSEDA